MNLHHLARLAFAFGLGLTTTVMSFGQTPSAPFPRASAKGK